MAPTDPSALPVLESPRLLIRALDLSGAPRLQAVYEAAPDYFTLLFGQPAPHPLAAEREIAVALERPGRAAAVLTLRETGEDVGAIGWWTNHPSPQMALLGMILVVPAHRGAGIGREALRTLEEWLVERGVNSLRTAFQRRRFDVHDIVKGMGFREMSIAEHTKLGMGGVGTSLWEKEIG